MIHLEGPHMGLYDSRSTNRVQMWNTWAVSRSESIGHMVEWVAAVARSAPGGKLRNLVFRCHGDSGYLQMGAGIKLSDIPQFSAWRGLVDRTYFSACSVAHIDSARSNGGVAGSDGNLSKSSAGVDAERRSNGGVAGSDGNRFCSEFARTVGCYLVAGTEPQVIGRNRVLPYGCLDTFEGLVLTYSPAGGICGQHRWPSTYDRGRGRGGMAHNAD